MTFWRLGVSTSNLVSPNDIYGILKRMTVNENETVVVPCTPHILKNLKKKKRIKITFIAIVKFSFFEHFMTDYIYMGSCLH